MQTGLWQSAFSSRADDPFQAQRARLSTALLAFRSNVEPIVQRIAHVLPGLTVHDVTHLDALWETADMIAGEGYPLNPLEAFVFGASVLLHDSAMCWEAYEHGIEGVRASTEWKDAYAVACEAWPNVGDAERMASADFSALRELHALQAARLPTLAWTHPDTRESLYLIEDAQLRTELGLLAGRIASSHHWDIDDLVRRLGEQFNAPPPFPPEWSVDPVKVACLLRCADAAHINHARAPLFLYALVKRQGLSLQHWTAQSRLMGPSLDMGDSEKSSIVYTASRPFQEDEAPAWWIAHDAIAIVDRELRHSNALLKSRQRPESAPGFQVRRVTGADSIENLIQHVPVDGWSPCKAEPHISNVESLIRDLGGEKLYGSGEHNFQVVLRELLQNARDAVVARRFVDNGFVGHITVRIVGSGPDLWLFVEDDGIGMSRRVMTGPLLDFGQSFWKSALIQSEFPGLRSSRFRSIGRFGIGFYSVFMIANRVEVTSRKWDTGLDDCTTLRFSDGLSMRPILRSGRVQGIASIVSTRVALRLKPGWLGDNGEIDIKPPFFGAASFSVPVHELISTLVVGLDVPVVVESPWRAKIQVHGGAPGNTPDPAEILHRIAFARCRRDAAVQQAIARIHTRLRPIRANDQVFGVATISTLPNSNALLLSLQTIGGLAGNTVARHSGSFIGYIDYKPESARRDAATFEAPEDVMKAWASEQLQLLEESGLNDLERCCAGLHALEFGCDPTSLGRILVSSNQLGTRFMTYAELAALAETCPIGFLQMHGFDHVDTHNSIVQVAGTALFRPLTNSRALASRIVDGHPIDPNTVVGWLDRMITTKGRTAVWEVRESGLRSNLGEPLDLLTVASKVA